MKTRLRPYTGGVVTRCLSFHAGYRCRHQGACCRADWDIEVDPRIIRVSALPRGADGECGFHQDHRCELQVKGGEAMLPAACRHFPRVLLRDTRGTLLTLSHFCPTAASMLFGEAEVTIVEASAPLALEEPLEGLDARDALPPLLRPGMLSDIEGYAAWEEAVILTFTGSGTVEAAFAHIIAATERVRIWRPSDGPLAQAVAAAFAKPAAASPRPGYSPGFDVLREATGAHPLLYLPNGFDPATPLAALTTDPRAQRVVGRYLAASAFGNWVAYRGQGLRSIVEWLRATYDVLRIQLTRDPLLEAIRHTDWIMVHTADSADYGRAAVALEY